MDSRDCQNASVGNESKYLYGAYYPHRVEVCSRVRLHTAAINNSHAVGRYWIMNWFRPSLQRIIDDDDITCHVVTFQFWYWIQPENVCWQNLIFLASVYHWYMCVPHTYLYISFWSSISFLPNSLQCWCSLFVTGATLNKMYLICYLLRFHCYQKRTTTRLYRSRWGLIF